jgi:hypothetical protein
MHKQFWYNYILSSCFLPFWRRLTYDEHFVADTRTLGGDTSTGPSPASTVVVVSFPLCLPTSFCFLPTQHCPVPSVGEFLDACVIYFGGLVVFLFLGLFLTARAAVDCFAEVKINK